MSVSGLFECDGNGEHGDHADHVHKFAPTLHAGALMIAGRQFGTPRHVGEHRKRIAQVKDKQCDHKIRGRGFIADEELGHENEDGSRHEDRKRENDPMATAAIAGGVTIGNHAHEGIGEDVPKAREHEDETGRRETHTEVLRKEGGDINGNWRG